MKKSETDRYYGSVNRAVPAALGENYSSLLVLLVLSEKVMSLSHSTNKTIPDASYSGCATA